MTIASTASINLNLSADYCPSWSRYEIVREFIANAIDSGEHEIEFIDDNTVLIKSIGSPSLEESLIIGQTSKVGRSDTIGQFGEGMKVASLAATRASYPLRISTRQYAITFSLTPPPNFTTPTLHALLSPPDPLGKWGCVIRLTAPDLRSVISKNIKPRLAPGPILRDQPGSPRIYSQGIFISLLSGDTAIFDWNLPKIPLNRDRNLLNSWDVKTAIVPLLCKQMSMDSDTVALLFSNPMSFEVTALRYNSHLVTEDGRHAIVAHFRKTYGDKAVLTSRNASIDARAIRAGYFVVDGLSDNLLRLLGEIPGIQSAENTVIRGNGFNIIPFASPALDELTIAADILNIPCSVSVFDDPEPLGCVRQGTNTILLNRCLFDPGQRNNRLGTFAHECAHIRSGADDGSTAFEECLTTLLGELLAHTLNTRNSA